MTDFSEMVGKFSKPNTDKTGSFLSKLNTEEQAEITRFGEWLSRTTEMTTASVASYRSYLAGAMVAFKAGESRESLTSSQRSAVNKYGEYLEQLGKQTS